MRREYRHQNNAISRVRGCLERNGMTSRNMTTTQDVAIILTDNPTEKVNFISELYAQNVIDITSILKVNTKGRDDAECPISYAEFREDAIMHQELLPKDHVFRNF